MSYNANNIITVIENTLSPEALAGGNRFHGTDAANLAQGLRAQVSEVRKQARADYIENKLGVGAAITEEQEKEIANYEVEALRIYKETLIQNVKESRNDEPIVSTEASDTFIKNLAGNTLSGAFTGNVTGSFWNALLSGASSLIMGMPMVGDMIRKTTIYVQHMFSGKEEDKNFSFEDAGKVAEAQKKAEQYTGFLPASVEDLMAVMQIKFKQPVTSFNQLDKDGNKSLSAQELKGLDKNNDASLSKDEIPEAMRAQFDAMLAKQTKVNDEIPQSLELGNLSATGIPLANFQPASAAK